MSVTVTSTLQLAGDGALTVDTLADILNSIIEAHVPSDAVVTIATMDSQREGSSWRATVAWREGR